MERYAYLPMFEHDARRHEARAAYWRAHGNEEYARGSDRKAKRWRDRQAALTRPALDNALLEGILQRIERDMIAKMERAIFG